jgi:hypothetical protein
MFDELSRYYSIPTATWQAPGGQEISYARRRLLPPLESVPINPQTPEHRVAQKDRLDNVTAHYLGNPELFWWVCDANTEMDPADLMQPIGRFIRIPLPSGA